MDNPNAKTWTPVVVLDDGETWGGLGYLVAFDENNSSNEFDDAFDDCDISSIASLVEDGKVDGVIILPDDLKFLIDFVICNAPEDSFTYKAAAKMQSFLKT